MNAGLPAKERLHGLEAGGADVTCGDRRCGLRSARMAVFPPGAAQQSRISVPRPANSAMSCDPSSWMRIPAPLSFDPPCTDDKRARLALANLASSGDLRRMVVGGGAGRSGRLRRRRRGRRPQSAARPWLRDGRPKRGCFSFGACASFAGCVNQPHGVCISRIPNSSRFRNGGAGWDAIEQQKLERSQLK